MGNKRYLFEHREQAVISWEKVLAARFSDSFNNHSEEPLIDSALLSLTLMRPGQWGV